MKRGTGGIATDQGTGGAVDGRSRQGRLDYVQTSLASWREASPPPRGVNSDARTHPRSTQDNETKAARPDAWTEAVDRFVRLREAEQVLSARWLHRLRWSLNRFPGVWKRLGVVQVPRIPGEVTLDHLSILRTSSEWEKSTCSYYFCALRQFVRWAGNDLAENRAAWRPPPGIARRRRWLTKSQLMELFCAAPPRARLIVALEGFNGLRRIEVLRLRVKDVNLKEGLLDVHGKGRQGGKWRRIPMNNLVQAELNMAIAGKGPNDRILPIGPTWTDKLLKSAAVSAHFPERGICVSNHDLRRSFGRIAFEAGADLVQLKALYGHKSLEMTTHYIEADVGRMRQGLDLLAASLKGLLGRSQGPEA
jgi:integrase